MLTETQLSARRAERNMKSRVKAKERCRLMGETDQTMARLRNRSNSWLSTLAGQQKKSEEAQNEQRRLALESRRDNRAMPEHRAKGVIGHVMSFFQRRGR